MTPLTGDGLTRPISLVKILIFLTYNTAKKILNIVPFKCYEVKNRKKSTHWRIIHIAFYNMHLQKFYFMVTSQGLSIHKWKSSHHLLTFICFQTGLSFPSSKLGLRCCSCLLLKQFLRLTHQSTLNVIARKGAKTILKFLKLFAEEMLSL